MSFQSPPAWTGPSGDPNDEQFGDVIEATDLERADDYAAVLVGEPYDGAVIGRRGAREGPGAIREALAGVKSHHFDAGPLDSVGDLGDVDVDADASPADAQDRVREAASEVHATDAFPVFLGGDNSLSFANVAPLLSGSVGVVSFDAHLDCREPRDGPTSGTPYHQLLEAGLDAFAVVGARHFETSTAYHDYVREHDGHIVTAEEVAEDPVAAIDRAVSAMADVDAVYVSLDVDVLDATAAPGVSAPTPGGLATVTLYRALRQALADDRVAGFEVVECAPPLDRDGLTVDAAARAVAHALGGRFAGGAR